MAASTIKLMGRIVLVFGAVCYLTSCAMDGSGGDVQLQETLKAEGGVAGPFTVDEPGTVLDVTVQQRIAGRYGSYKRWSFITAELLGADGQYLTGFGGELWNEAGPGWQEDDQRYSTKLTIPEAGRYSLRFRTEADVSASELSPIQVFVRSQRGSSLPHYAAAWAAFLAGGGLWLWGNARAATSDDASR